MMRLAGTVNYKTGAYARIVEADLRLPAYRLEELVGDLPDPQPPAAARASARATGREDPYKRIAPPEYFARLAGITVPRARARVVPGEGARGPPPLLQRRRRPRIGLVLSRRLVRGARRDLRPRLRARRRAVGARAARRGVHARPRARARGVRRAAMTARPRANQAARRIRSAGAGAVRRARRRQRRRADRRPRRPHLHEPAAATRRRAHARRPAARRRDRARRRRRVLHPPVAIAGGRRTVTVEPADPTH